MEVFKLGIGDIEFNDEECAFRDNYKVFIELWLRERDDFLQNADDLLELEDKEECLLQLQQLAERIIKKCVKEGVIQTLIQHKIYTYDLEDILGEYDILENWQECYGDLNENYTSIKEKNALQHEYRQYRKDNRGRWQGGGFGVTGALKGAATASVMNGMTGIAHSLGNAVGNAYSDYKANKAIKGLFANELLMDLQTALGEDIINLSDVLTDLLIKHGKHIKIYSQEELNKSYSIYNNYEQIRSSNDKKNALIEGIKYNPYYEGFYELYLNDFYENIEQEQEFERMCSYFFQDLEQIKIQLLTDDLFQQGLLDDQEQIDLLVQYLHNLKSWGISKEDMLENEKEFITVYDIVPDFKHGIRTNTASKEKFDDIIKRFNRAEAISVIDLQKLFLHYNFPIIDGEEELNIHGAKMALKVARQRKQIREIYEKIDFTKRDSVLKALSTLEQIKHRIVGKEIINFLRCVALITDAIFDFYIEHDDFNENLKKFKHGEFKSSPLISYNLKTGATYEHKYFNKVFYINDKLKRKEIFDEIQNIQKEYEQMDFHNENALKALKESVKKVFKDTQLGGLVIREIAKRLNYIDLCERTVLGVTYDTREEAAQERKKVVGDQKYDTIDQANMAQKDIDYIDNFISQTQSSSNLVHYIEMFQKLKNETFTTVSGQEKVREIENDIIKKYVKMSESISIFEQDKNKIKVWIVAALIGTVIGIPMFFNLGLFGKIICVLIVLGLWNTAWEQSEGVRNFNYNTLTEKKQIDDIMFIQNNKIYFKELKEKNVSQSQSYSQTNVCPQCGNTISDEMKFCTKCGKKLKEN